MVTVSILRSENSMTGGDWAVCINKKVRVECNPSFDIEAMEAAGDDNPLKYRTGGEVSTSPCDRGK